MSSIRRK